VLLKEIGYEPRGLVVGSAVYHIGIQYANWTTNQEMSDLTQAMYQARTEALTAMERHAQQVGGQGVVGLKLESRSPGGHRSPSSWPWARRWPTHREVEWGVGQRPLRSDLYLLIRSGYQPIGLAFGACVYHVAHQRSVPGSASRARTSSSATTLGPVRGARAGHDRMQQEAQRARAHGIVAMRIEQKSHMWGSHVIEFLASEPRSSWWPPSIGGSPRAVGEPRRRGDPGHRRRRRGGGGSEG